MTQANSASTAIAWQDNRLFLLDQRILPAQTVMLEYTDANAVAEAIHTMVVRGAPAIGITAAYGVVLAARQAYAQAGADWCAAIEPAMQTLAASRPTAVNLFWALARMRGLFAGVTGDPEAALLAEAQRIHQEDIAANRRMGDLGAQFIHPGSGVLTHCNAGALATGGYGTALGVIRSAHANGKLTRVFADETRPWLQGARLTAWELLQDHIPVTLVCEGAAASLIRSGQVQWIIVGADRIAANGDVANKIGTYGLAVLARHHGVRFMVAAPLSTIDMSLASGADIPIETRGADEIFTVQGVRVAAEGAAAWNPVFDVTPAELVDVIVTEQGAVEHPTHDKMRALTQTA